MKHCALFIPLFTLAACMAAEPITTGAADDTATPHARHTQTPSPSDVSLGNGEENRIQLNGITRNGPSLIVPEVMAEADSFLVLHPFADGAPVQTDYIGATFVPAGTQTNVAIRLDNTPDDGAPFIIMLHRDVNRDGAFQFGDGVTVADAPVFEGSTLIAMPMQVPSSTPVTPALIRSSAAEHLSKYESFRERADYRDAPAASRARALIHRWLVEVEAPTRSIETARPLFAPEFVMNFPSGPIDTTDALQAWLEGPAAAFAATRHVLSTVQHQEIEPGRSTVEMVMNWDGLTHTGDRMHAKTQHRWTIVDGGGDLPLIEQVDVEILEPFAPASWNQP